MAESLANCLSCGFVKVAVFGLLTEDADRLKNKSTNSMDIFRDHVSK